MFTHIMVGTNDIEKSALFYNAVLGALGVPPAASGERLIYSQNNISFLVGAPRDDQLATFANGGTVGFRAQDNAQVDAFYASGCAHGGTCEGAPGYRSKGPGNPYGAYLRDPDGNKICAFVRAK